MEPKQEPRIRLNAKHKATGEYQLDVTVETFGFEEPGILAARHVAILNAFEKKMKLAGKKLVGEGK